MQPLCTADAETVITWCFKYKVRTNFYISRLGLPQREDNKKTTGLVQFEGDLAGECTQLYKAIRQKREALMPRFKTKEQLRKDAVCERRSLIEEVTEPLLARYGATIWSTSPPFATVIDRRNYPERLKHDDESDRERLVTLDLACIEVLAEPKSRIMLYLYCWTIGGMIRGLGNNEGEINTRTARRSGLVYDLSDSDPDNLDPYRTRSRPIKRWGDPTQHRGQNQGHRKKQKMDGEKSAGNVNAISRRTNLEDMRSFLIGTRTDQAPTRTNGAGDATRRPGSEDDESLRRIQQTFGIRSGSPKAIPEPPRSVEPRRLTAQIKVTNDARRRLTTNLLEILAAGSELLSPLPLSQMIEILEALTETDQLRLRGIYGDHFNNVQTTLNQWVKCLKFLFESHELTELPDNLASRNAFLDKLPLERRLHIMKILNKGSSSLSQWRDHEQVTKQVAPMLFNLIWPQLWWNYSTMEDLVLEMNKRLSAWFD
jgi:hypothetical protein